MLTLEIPLPGGQAVSVDVPDDGTWEGSVAPVGSGDTYRVAAVKSGDMAVVYVDGEHAGTWYDGVLGEPPESRDPDVVERWLAE